MEQVDNDGLVSVDVFVPCFKTGVHVALSVRFVLLNVWFFLLFEQVFGHKVKNGVDTLLRIMLTVAFKGHVILTQYSFEEIWSDNIAITDPKLANKLGPSLNQSALSSQRILVFSLEQRLVLPIQVILGKFPCARKALNATVHVASVSKVIKSSKTFLRSVVEFIFVVLLQFVIGHGTAFVDVEPLVFFHAVIVAIFHDFTFADGAQDVSAVAPFAEPYHQVSSFDVFECKAIGRLLFELDNNLLVIAEINLVHSQRRIQERLKRLTWELDATVKLDIFAWCLLTLRFVFSVICLWLGNSLASGFQILISFMLILAIKPKTDIFHLDLKAS